MADEKNLNEEEVMADTEEATEETVENAEETVETPEEASEETAEETSEDAEAADEVPAKKDKKDQVIEELNDRVKRQMAEFDNFRKRTEKEKTQMFETGAKSIVEKILPVIDSFERGLATIGEDTEKTPFIEGMEMVYKQMMTTLEEAGVTAIDANGCEFDPNLHNAVMHIEDENLGENVVAQELQKGYKYRDTVVRHSMVTVAN